MSEMLLPPEARYRKEGLTEEADKVADLRAELEQIPGFPRSFRLAITDLEPGTVLGHPLFRFAPRERLLFVQDKSKKLLPIAAKILFELMLDEGKAVDSSLLYEKASGYHIEDPGAANQATKGHISYLRKAFAELGLDPHILYTHHHFGYRLKYDENDPEFNLVELPRRNATKVSLAGYDYYPDSVDFKVDGQRNRLTKLEARLMDKLVLNRGMIVSKRILVDCAWDDPEMGSEELLKTHFSHIRRKARSKINPTPSDIQYAGEGYILLGEIKNEQPGTLSEQA